MRMSRTAGTAKKSGSGLFLAIYRAVRRIPAGCVSTYGAIARLSGHPGLARQVGYALAALPHTSTVPWHRVINAQGRITLSDANGAATTQRLRLLAEGIAVDGSGRVSLREFGWKITE